MRLGWICAEFARLAAVLAAGFVLVACGDDAEEQTAEWRVVAEDLDSALLSVWGTAADDVWAVGGNTDDGPLVMHYDGAEWETMNTGQAQGTLWWVFGFENGPVFMGGAGGMILKYDDGDFSRMDTPGEETVFGIWGASPDDVWAVGGESESGGGFAWRYDGRNWTANENVTELASESAIWKVYGTSEDDAWLVGSNGISLHWDGDELSEGDTGVGSSLFTVHASNKDLYVAVGGLATGIIVEYDERWRNVTPRQLTDGLSGVCLGEAGDGYAVGAFGTVYRRSEEGWQEEITKFNLDENLHAVWLDPEGGVWAVGGQTYVEPLSDGVLVHYGMDAPTGGL